MRRGIVAKLPKVPGALGIKPIPKKLKKLKEMTLDGLNL
jgi:hypothetical protein